MFTQEERMKYIGGSDISSVMGLNRWKTQLQLWAEKAGEIKQEDLSNNEAVELGTELEDFVAKKFEKKTGKKVRRDSRIFTHKKYDYMVAHIDRRITGEEELLECKTASAWKLKEWKETDEIPQEYLLQVQWYLGILEMNKGYIAVLIGGQKFVWKEIVFDQELFDIMVEKAKVFWDMVQKKIPPMAVGNDSDTLLNLYPNNSSDEVIEANNDLNVAIAKRAELSMHIDEMLKEKKEIEASIKQIIGDNLGLRTNKYTILWKPQTRKSVDSKKIKEDNLFDKYCKETSTRVLQVRLNKEE